MTDITVIVENETWTLKPFGPNDEIQGYDIFDAHGEWFGSRRTIEYCKQQIYNIISREARQEEMARIREEAKKYRQEISKKRQTERKNRVEKELSGQIEDYDKIAELLSEIIAANPKKVEDARKNPNAQNWFMGQILKQHKGKPISVKKVISDWFEKN